jgi:hypothetical protein
MSKERMPESGSLVLDEPLGRPADAEAERAGSSLAATVWKFYTQAVGIIGIAGAISLGVMRILSKEGPVVEVVEGPFPISTEVPYRGTLSYRLSTRRLESCDGTSVFTFTRESPRVTVVIARPILAQEIRPTIENTVRIELPDSVYPGAWHFQAVVDSRCPAYARQDVTAAFEIEVLSPGVEGQ